MQVIGIGQTIRELEDRLAIPCATMAAAVKVNERTVRRWLENAAFPQGNQRDKLAELLDVANRLDEVFVNRDAAHRWMSAESTYLGGMRPVEALRAGRPDRVVAALEAIASGFAS